jgi:hypothetical protein
MDNLELELIQLINITLKNQEIFLILTMAKTKLSWLHAVPTFLFATLYYWGMLVPDVIDSI